MQIITNNIQRDIVSFWQLPKKAQDQHREDYENAEELDWFCYKGEWYCLDDFMRLDKESPFSEWDGYASDTFFSGVLIKLVDDRVIVGRYYS